MNQLQFSSFAQALEFSKFQGQNKYAFGIPEESEFFVEPALIVKEGLGDLSADIILVSARGAAGKSRTAMELASRSGAPLWRLEADDAVGRAALPLNLNTYTSSVDALSQIEQLSTRPAIFIDSLDEARSRVSAQSWEEFLDSVSDASSRNLRIILFGRDRTLEDVWLKLEEDGRRIAWLEVSHFSDNSQRVYIDGRVQRSDKGANIDVTGVSYQGARDMLVSALSGALDDKFVETFVGYPPVLDAVATVLADEQNHHKVAQDFSSNSAGPRPIGVLRQILADLLIREQGKLTPLVEELELDPQIAYTPNEQIQWLWADIMGGPTPKLDYISDPAKRSEYMRGLRRFLEDHPFRTEKRWASTVFEAYAAAESLPGNLSSQILVDVGTHSGLLFDFVSAANIGLEIDIDEWQFASLHASILAGELRDSVANVSATRNDDGYFTGEMGVFRSSGTLTLNFILVPSQPDVLSLYGPLASLTVVTPGGISVPPLGNGRVIGPDLFLRCAALAIEGAEAQFARTASSTTHGGADIHIEVVGNRLTLPPSISIPPTKESFEILVNDSTQLAYPWFDYKIQIEPDEEINMRSRAIRFLNKLQNLARTHGHSDGRATFYMKLQGRQPLKSDQLRAVLGILEKRGAVRRDGELIFLTREADQHRFSGKALQGQRTIEEEWDYWGPIVDDIESALDIDRA